MGECPLTKNKIDLRYLCPSHWQPCPESCIGGEAIVKTIQSYHEARCAECKERPGLYDFYVGLNSQRELMRMLQKNRVVHSALDEGYFCLTREYWDALELVLGVEEAQGPKEEKRQ